VRGGESRGAVGHVGGAAEEDGVVGVGRGRDCRAGGGEAAPDGCEAERAEIGGRSRRSRERPRRRRHG
jgi:hypothetical protein